MIQKSIDSSREFPNKRKIVLINPVIIDGGEGKIIDNVDFNYFRYRVSFKKNSLDNIQSVQLLLSDQFI